ncbi:hypothetical protein [uncultured Erythrobacter sp.]|uniref:hypothetical protein n=1 Tax=uncultured Erythrobacter sp. TaxID=263913 RepID=UPI00261A26E1|nr:hypothetical protein [uncultured Erythrobacter sp.]
MNGDLMVMIMIISIIGISIGSVLIHTWIQAKHGHPLEDSSDAKVDVETSKTIERIETENRERNDKLDHMQDRMVVLEKIVTERGYSLSDEIEALRSLPTPDADTGRALNIPIKEPQS